MTEDFEQVYKTLFETYGAPPERPPFPPPTRLSPADLRTVIQVGSEVSMTKRVRADAAYFLLMNLYQMVALPMRYRAVPNQNIGLEDVAEDVQLILKTAENISAGRQVSGNDVLAATAALRHRLRINASEIWG